LSELSLGSNLGIWDSDDAIHTVLKVTGF